MNYEYLKIQRTILKPVFQGDKMESEMKEFIS